MQQRLRVIVIEDDADTRDWLCKVISADERLVLTASGGTVAQGRILLTRPHDVLVVDLGLPDGSGIELIRQAARDSATHCLILTVFGDSGSVLEAIQAGADGYVLKDTADITGAIVEVASGHVPLSPAVAAHVLDRIRSPQSSVAVDYDLTPRETQTLEQLARGRSYREAAHALGISHHTVADHVKMIYKKLSVHSRGGAVYKGLQAGLIQIETP